MRRPTGQIRPRGSGPSEGHESSLSVSVRCCGRRRGSARYVAREQRPNFEHHRVHPSLGATGSTGTANSGSTGGGNSGSGSAATGAVGGTGGTGGTGTTGDTGSGGAGAGGVSSAGSTGTTGAAIRVPAAARAEQAGSHLSGAGGASQTSLGSAGTGSAASAASRRRGRRDRVRPWTVEPAPGPARRRERSVLGRAPCRAGRRERPFPERSTGEDNHLSVSPSEGSRALES